MAVDSPGRACETELPHGLDCAWALSPAPLPPRPHAESFRAGTAQQGLRACAPRPPEPLGVLAVDRVVAASWETGGTAGLGAALPPADPRGSGLGVLLAEPISGAGRGGVISWLRSRLSAVTWLASLGAGCAGKRVVGEGPWGPGRRRGPVRSGGLLLGCWLPGPQAPTVPWLSLGGG